MHYSGNDLSGEGRGTGVVPFPWGTLFASGLSEDRSVTSDKTIPAACESCEEHAPYAKILVSTILGSADGKLVWMWLCGYCFHQPEWQEANLAAEEEAWRLALREASQDDSIPCAHPEEWREGVNCALCHDTGVRERS